MTRVALALLAVSGILVGGAASNAGLLALGLLALMLALWLDAHHPNRWKQP